MFTLLRRLFQRQRTRTVYECRRCGQVLKDETGACPACGWAGIAIHEIEV